MRNTPGLDANTTATKMLSWFGVDRDDAERIRVEDQADIDPAADDKRQAEQQVDPVGSILEARPEQRREEDDREDEEHARQRIWNRRVHDRRIDQQIEQQDDRKGEHEVGQERQDRIDPAAVVASRQPERDADHNGEGGSRRGDDQHDLAAEHHAAEHVARQPVTAKQIGPPAARFDRSGQRVLHDRYLSERVERRDVAGKDCREQPEKADRHAGDADAAVEQLPVQSELLLVVDARAEHDCQRQPHRPEARKKAKENLEPADVLHSGAPT